MLYLIWTLPALSVLGLIASGKMGTLWAALSGLAIALVVAALTAPAAFPPSQALQMLARGLWIGWIVVPYILGGLFFWRMAMPDPDADNGTGAGVTGAGPQPDRLQDGVARRRFLFAACFLIGPFAESATGFGVGIIGTMLLVRRLSVPPLYLLGFSLLSQTMILWGGMGSGAIVGAAFARIEATEFAVHASLYQAIFTLMFLPLYWRMAARAGIGAPLRAHLIEAVWMCAGLALAIGATALLGPETAMLAAYGPLIVLRYLCDMRPSRPEIAAAIARALPFILLILWLVLTRLVPPLGAFLKESLSFAPFAGAPVWQPLFHAGSWLVVGGLLCGALRGRTAQFPAEFRGVWTTGRLAVLTVIVFAMMAEVLSGSGIAAGLARGIFAALGAEAILITPLISAVFGMLSNSANAANGLFMASQVNLARDAGLDLGAVIALQHGAALSLTMLSPVRMSILCSLAGLPGQERALYRLVLPVMLGMIAVLGIGAGLILANL